MHGHWTLCLIMLADLKRSALVITPDHWRHSSTLSNLFSIRYHNLHPDYIHERLKQLGNRYDLRILLVQVDVVSWINILLNKFLTIIHTEFTIYTTHKFLWHIFELCWTVTHFDKWIFSTNSLNYFEIHPVTFINAKGTCLLLTVNIKIVK
jgi:DNA repair protein Rad10